MNRAEQTEEFAKVRAEATVRAHRGAYFWVVMVAYMVMCPAVSILVSRKISIDAAHKAVSESQLRLCSIVVLSDDYYRKLAAASPIRAIKAQAVAMAQLRAEYHCPPTQGVPR
jgi:hypothetical protein